MSAVLIEAAEEKYTKKKRESGAFESVGRLVSAAAADFLAKRSRPSASTGKSVDQSGIAMAFARRGAIGADAKATAAMADMVHSEGLPDGFLEKPEVNAAMMAHKATSGAYELPGGKKDGSFIAKEMDDAMAILGHKYFFLAILDGASKIQSAGRIIMALSKQLTVQRRRGDRRRRGGQKEEGGQGVEGGGAADEGSV